MELRQIVALQQMVAQFVRNWGKHEMMTNNKRKYYVRRCNANTYNIAIDIASQLNALQLIGKYKTPYTDALRLP
jgi:hypothetical protein